MNNEIRALNNIKLCKTCAAEIDLNARFCSKCGAEQNEETKEAENTDNKIEEVINAEPVYPVEPEVIETEGVEEQATETTNEVEEFITHVEQPGIIEPVTVTEEPQVEETMTEEPTTEETTSEENNEENY